MLICGPSSNKLYGWTYFEIPVSILCLECKVAILAEASRLDFNYVLWKGFLAHIEGNQSRNPSRLGDC